MRLQRAVDRPGPDRLVVARSARDRAARRAPRQPIAATFGATVRDPRRHRVRSRGTWLRRPAASARLDRQEVHRRLHACCTNWDGLTASRRGRTTSRDERARGRVVRRERSAVCSPPSRSSTASPTRRRSRWSHSSTCMRDGGGTLLDVQWTTPHLASLGAVDVPRGRLPRARCRGALPARRPRRFPRVASGSVEA